MLTTLSPTLEAEQSKLIRSVAASATVERWLPEWTEKIAPSLAWAHGHDSVIMTDGNGAGEDILFRARVSSSRELEIAVIKGVDLDDASTWEGLYSGTGITGLMAPVEGGTVPEGYGGDVCTVVNGSDFRVFVSDTSGNVKYYDFNSAGSQQASGTITTLSGFFTSIQFGACKSDEIIIVNETLVEAANDTWQDAVYGAELRRFTYSGSWTEDTEPFLFHSHSKANLLTDGAGTGFSEVETQWGFRPNGGIAVHNIDDNTMFVAVGMRHYWQPSYFTHTQGITCFLYHRQSGVWERTFINDEADYDLENQLWLDMFAKASICDGRNFLIFIRMIEPIDSPQDNASLTIPRQMEAVFCQVSDNGRYLTHYNYVGPADEWTSFQLVAINHGGAKKLYALGYEGVLESPASAILCDVPAADKIDLEDYSSLWKFSNSNRAQLQIQCPLTDASARFNTFFSEGNIIRIYAGIEGDQVQIAQGYIDSSSPQVSVRGRGHSASVTARAELQLLNTKAELIEDILPCEIYFIKPDTPDEAEVPSNTYDGVFGAIIRRDNPPEIEEIYHPADFQMKGGFWKIAKKNWIPHFFAGTYPNLLADFPLSYRNDAYPFVLTGGDPDQATELDPFGGPGICAEQHKRGTWFSDISNVIMHPRVDVCIQAGVRMGDPHNQKGFSFTSEQNTRVIVNDGDIHRTDGLITNIEYRDSGNAIWNDVHQESCMAGIVFRSVHDENDPTGAGKKYMFVWEANSDLASASHYEDQAYQVANYAEIFDQPDYGGLATGANNFYLFMSDFDEEDVNWQSGDKYLHKALLYSDSTLLPGRPADMRVHVIGGTAYMFMRDWNDGQKNLWLEAGQYKTGHFGAGEIGLVARSQISLLWDDFKPACDKVKRLINTGEFWDVRASDTVRDITVEELLEKYCWQGHTNTVFRSLLDISNIVVDGSVSLAHYDVSMTNDNLCVDFQVELDTSGGEAGLWLRSTNAVDPTQGSFYLGIQVHDTRNVSGVINCNAVFRKYESGNEVLTKLDFAPSPFHLKPNVPYNVRISLRNENFILYVGGNYIGHFRNEDQLGSAWGLYTTGCTATFHNVRLPELHQIPENSLVDVGQSMFDIIGKLIGERHIKGVFQPDGSILWSRFNSHDTGPTLEDGIQEATVKRSDSFVSICEVQGAYVRAQYSDTALLRKGRRYHLVNQPNLMTVEECYAEAQYYVNQSAELMDQVDLTIIPDIRLQPEDEIAVTNPHQSISGKAYYVDDVQYAFDLSKRKYESMVSARQVYP